MTRVERTAQQTLEASQQRVESLQSRAEALDTAIAEQDSRVRSLERRPEIEQQEALRSLGQRAAAAEQHAAEAARRLDDAEQEHRSLEQEQQKVSADLDAEQRRLDSVESGAVEQSEACSLRMEHEMRAEGLRTDPSSASRILKSVVDARRSALQHTRRLLRNHEDAQAAHARAERTRDDLVDRRNTARDKVARRESTLSSEIEAVGTAVVSWATECRQARWSDEALEGLLRAVRHAGDAGGPDLAEAEEAGHIGAAARERARQRRLDALDRTIAELERTARELDQRRGDLDRRLDELTQERTSCPDDRTVREARTLLDVARKTAAELDAEVERAEQQLTARRTELHEASEALHSYAGEHSLPTTPAGLDQLDVALTDYLSTVRELLSRYEQIRTKQQHLGSVHQRVQRQQDRLDQYRHEHDQAGSAARDLRTEHTTRNELIGADVERVLAELSEATDQLGRRRQERTEVGGQQQAAAEQLGSAQQALQSAQEQRAQREADRAAAVDAFEKLRHHGFLDLAGVSSDETTGHNLTRSIEDARRAEQALHGEDIDERARNNARNTVDERFRELQRQIESADWRPWGDNDGELFVVKVTHNEIDRSLPELHEIIEREIETRRGYLDEQERNLFKEVLLGRVGEHLRQRRVEANSLKDRMNRLLKERPTASGMQMQLIWEPDPEAGPEVQRAVSLLDRQAAQFLTDEARDELIGFLASRVRQTRDDDLVGDWKNHLHQALDYRYWSRFRLQVKHGTGGWSELTDAKHQQGSGGERAVMLQLPLFVAAAAHYEAAASSAPRPVYLDEAFAGIDAEMRGSCMQLLAQLDLDFVMASHDEWGFHSEVRGLATYNLYRDPDVPGVLTTPFIWDGRESHELSDPALRDDDADDGTDEDGLPLE